MRTRRRHSSPVSLFAFQDVMAAVIGILFFIVLLVSLDIIETKMSEKVVDLAESELLIQGLHSKIHVLNEKKQQLLKSAKTIEKKINILSSANDRDILNEIKQCESKLKDLYAKINQNHQTAREVTTQLQENNRTYKQKLLSLEQLDEQITRLKAQVDDAESSPSMAYIIDDKLSLTAWLVEISSGKLRVAPSEGIGSVLEFNGTTKEDVFLAWAKSRDSTTEYFVLLIKPSGLQLYRQILGQKLKMLGFDIGTDLIPENAKVF